MEPTGIYINSNESRNPINSNTYRSGEREQQNVVLKQTDFWRILFANSRPLMFTTFIYVYRVGSVKISHFKRVLTSSSKKGIRFLSRQAPGLRSPCLQSDSSLYCVSFFCHEITARPVKRVHSSVPALTPHRPLHARCSPLCSLNDTLP